MKNESPSMNNSMNSEVPVKMFKDFIQNYLLYKNTEAIVHHSVTYGLMTVIKLRRNDFGDLHLCTITDKR